MEKSKLWILTNRNYEQRHWYDLVREWEDDILKFESMNVSLDYEFPIFKNRNWQLVPGLFWANLNKKHFPLLYFEMRANVFHFWKGGKTLVPWIIDWFVNPKYLWLYEWMYRKHRLVLVSSMEVYAYLKRQSSNMNVEHLGLSLSDRYKITKYDRFEKMYDVVLLGRQNETMMEYLNRYKEQHPNLSVYKPARKDVDTREGYMREMRKGRIGIYAAPGFDADAKRTHGFSQVTPRFLEYVASGCHIIARYMDNEDSKYYELEKFSPSVENYGIFEKLMDKALSTQVDMEFYADYLEKHYTSTRCAKLKKILNEYE